MKLAVPAAALVLAAIALASFVAAARPIVTRAAAETQWHAELTTFALALAESLYGRVERLRFPLGFRLADALEFVGVVH